MFNQELKEKFISEITTEAGQRENYAYLFKATEKFEDEWGADLCTKGAKDLQPLVNDLIGTRFRSRAARYQLLKNYIRWCVKHNVPGAIDETDGLNIDGVDKMRKRTVTGPLHLQACLDRICDPESAENVDNIYRCYLWLAFSGMPESDIFLVTNKDVDFSSAVVRFGGKEYPIYTEGFAAIKNCATLSEFAANHPNYKEKIYLSRVPGNELIRGIKGKQNPGTMHTEISRRIRKKKQQGKTDMELSYNRVWISGLYYRLYERERAGFPLDFFAVATFMAGQRPHDYKSAEAERIYLNHISRELRTDYEIWKMTF